MFNTDSFVVHSFRVGVYAICLVVVEGDGMYAE